MTEIATGRLELPEARLSVPGGLPDPLVCSDGTVVRTPDDWFGRRRPELLALFERHMFGQTPAEHVEVRTDVVTVDPTALDGRATRAEVRLAFGPASGPAAGAATARPEVGVLLHLPNDTARPAPVFLALNFRGNTVAESGADPARASADETAPNPPWPIAEMIGRGYGVATACYEDIDPDVDDFGNGVHPLFYADGQTCPADDGWGAIGAWAWGLSRIMDHLVTDPRIDPRRVIVVGHSRLGKAALWAAARDERFAMAVSNNSGCGGAALSRRRVGETVEAITTRFPHWFSRTFASYAGREQDLPVDQHLLLALVAPRPVYVASAENDEWADPYGEFLGGRYADPVYRLLGVEGLVVDEMPPVSAPVPSRIGYHIRPGGHAMTTYDWERFADAADRHLG